ncbi:MAG: CpaF family protein [Lachnospiraceae bacterium]
MGIYHFVKSEIHTSVVDRLREIEVLEDEAIIEIIEDIAYQNGQFKLLEASQKARLCREVYYAIRKLDLLEILLEQEDISEIMINSYQDIFVERHGKIERYPLAFESNERYLDIIQQIVARCNRTVNGANPIVDARLEDGSRVNVVLEPVSLKGTAMTIRHFSNFISGMSDLIQIGSISSEAAVFLQKLVKAKYNIFISGGTGSGKTTFLNALSGYIPSEERIITIEDSAELQLQGAPNLVQLETRNGNGDENHQITIRDLIKTSLRMRPDRIIVGEIRGGEAVDMLQAMNSGQQGSLSTGHSNSARDMINRLETLYLMGMELPLTAIRRQILAIDIIVHLGRIRDKTRKVLEIYEVLELQGDEIAMNPLYLFEETGEEGGRVSGELQKINKLVHTTKLKMAGIEISA